MGGPDGTVRSAFERTLRRLADPSLAPQGGAGPRLGARTGPVPESLRPLLPVDPVPAAVLVAFIDRGADPGILLTVRAAHLRKHGGQISFPGGRIEPGDADPAAAAMREAYEEIGLPPQGVTVVGQLPDQIVLTGFRITPVVARIETPFVPRLDPSEVQELFELPLSQLLDVANHQTYRRTLAGTEVDMRDIRFGRHRIWGATAGILLTLREYASE
jgi:8-oxo-dGTP pyrophosphatase MutT (NUDIX family)